MEIFMDGFRLPPTNLLPTEREYNGSTSSPIWWLAALN